MLLQFIVVFIVLGGGMFFSVKTGKLTELGALTGGLLGIAIFIGAGFTGLILLGTFFILGTAASAWQVNYKTGLGLAEENKGRRTASQAIANAGISGLLGILSWLYPEKGELFCLMLAGGFAAATADTLSSELGNIYGRKYYNILTLKPDKRGLNGIVSIEGTLIGVLGSTLIAFIYGMGIAWGWEVAGIIIAGIIGNLTDSVLGATLERQRYLSNDAVNFLNTLVGALVAGLFYLLVR